MDVEYFAGEDDHVRNGDIILRWALAVACAVLGRDLPTRPHGSEEFDDFVGYRGQGDAFAIHAKGTRYRLGDTAAGLAVVDGIE